jgi:hypothetical protein
MEAMGVEFTGRNSRSMRQVIERLGLYLRGG